MEEFDFEVKELVYRGEGNTGEFIAFDPGRCDGCGLCVKVCSAGLWSLKEGKARLAPRYRELCLECAACWEICAREAIDFSYPAGGTGVTIRYG